MTTVAAPAQTSNRLGFTSLEAETDLATLPVRGALPPWLTGSLLRTGPAKWEVGDEAYRHWFDGLAMLHRFAFGDGGVSYRNRFLRGRTYRAAEETGAIPFPEFGTDPCRSIFKRLTSSFSPDFGDNANVNLARLGEEFVAMTETPIPVAFDPETLEAAGVPWSPPGQITTAHPHHDPQRGELVNFAARLGPRSSYRFFAQRDRHRQRALGSLSVRTPGYVHSFGMTERFLVLAEFPFVVNPLRLALSGRPYIENYRWDPERGTRFHLVERETGERHGTWHTDQPMFAFHHVNAYEDGAGDVVVDMGAYEDATIMDALYLDPLRAGDSDLPTPRLRRARLGAGGSVAIEDRSPAPLELPRINYGRVNARPHRWAWGLSTAREGVWLDRIVKIDVETGEARTWAQDGAYPGEPVFVARPGAGAEDDGVLLSVVLDSERRASSLLVLDASSLDEVARAEVPHHIPFGFHGQYAAA
ncbi:MAG: carotenoid oxygenase family protein [Solirubrobacteraceae bacterium]